MPDGGFQDMTRFIPGPETARDFRDALGCFATGVTIVTCRDAGDRPLGITANSFASLSLDPPLVLWSPARSSRRFAAFEAAGHYAIHVLSDAQFDLCRQFALDGHDFSGLDWHENEAGVPLIGNSLACFECTRHAIHDGGDHAIIVGRVTAAARNDHAPLVFAKGSYGRFTDRG